MFFWSLNWFYFTKFVGQFLTAEFDFGYKVLDAAPVINDVHKNTETNTVTF